MIQQSLLKPVPNAVQTVEKFTVPFTKGDWVVLPYNYSEIEPLRTASAMQYPLYVESVSVCGTLLKVSSFAAGGEAFFIEAKHARFVARS